MTFMIAKVNADGTKDPNMHALLIKILHDETKESYMCLKWGIIYDSGESYIIIYDSPESYMILDQSCPCLKFSKPEPNLICFI